MAKKATKTAAGKPRPPLAPIAWFALRFFGALFAASLLFSLGGVHRALEPLQNALAAGGAFGARLLGTDAHASGFHISVSRDLVMLINHECTGVFVLLIWAALLLARQTTWRTRLWSFLAGVAIIQTINVARLATLAAIGAHWPGLFGYFHEYVWQGLFVAVIAVMAAAWPDDGETSRLVPR
jgi:exosortase/archaeosortase family protein